MVPDIQMEGHPNITIYVENTESSKLVVTERDLPESAVFIDTIRPNISLIGNETYHIIRYSTLDQIPGAIVYDGDPRYVPGYNLNISNIIENTAPITDVLETVSFRNRCIIDLQWCRLWPLTR